MRGRAHDEAMAELFQKEPAYAVEQYGSQPEQQNRAAIIQ